jgi:hypothetical protein
MKYCLHCGSGLAASGTCAACGFSLASAPEPQQQHRPRVRLQDMWPLVPLLFSFSVWAYHEYELNRSADAIRSSFDTIKATVDKSGSH